MRIEYYGHSCFRMVGNDGVRVVCDPYGDIGWTLPRLSADIVSVSHAHYDHDNVAAIDCPFIIREAGESEYMGVGIHAVSALHDEVLGKKRGRSLIFCFVIDGIRVCHMGDLGEPLSQQLLQQLGGIDVLLIPVGGNYTIDAEQAVEYIKTICPSFVIPMHYWQPGLLVDIAPLEHFLHLFSSKDIQLEGRYFFEIEQGGQISPTKIIVLDRKSE